MASTTHDVLLFVLSFAICKFAVIKMTVSVYFHGLAGVGLINPFKIGKLFTRHYLE